jgi:hypothetical protein
MIRYGRVRRAERALDVACRNLHVKNVKGGGGDRVSAEKWSYDGNDMEVALCDETKSPPRIVTRSGSNWINWRIDIQQTEERERQSGML